MFTAFVSKVFERVAPYQTEQFLSLNKVLRDYQFVLGSATQ